MSWTCDDPDTQAIAAVRCAGFAALSLARHGRTGETAASPLTRVVLAFTMILRLFQDTREETMARIAHAAVLEKQARAIELHAAGHSLDQIAGELAYANRSGAWKALTRGLSAVRDHRADEYLRLNLDRLDAILAAHWRAATEGGDVGAALIVLRVLAEMDRLLGLDRPDKRGGRKPAKPWGIVSTPEERVAWEAAGSPAHWTR